MKHFTIVGNWKMHGAPKEAHKLVKRLQEKIKPHTHVTHVVCPPYVSLAEVAGILEPDKLKLGAQNLNEYDEGAYTGEVAGPMLRECGANYVIIGHSERRRYEHEDGKRLADKMAAALRNELKPILCVGEKLTEHKEGHAERVVVDQLQDALRHVSDDDIREVLIAYEPVWAIGTGEFAKPDDVTKMVTTIRRTVEESFGEGASSHLEVLYGGSANPDNAKAYLEIPTINGLLVGGASLNPAEFTAIIETAGKLAK